MGGSLSCIDDQIPALQRAEYDLAPIKSRPIPLIWLIGPPGSGRNTHAKLLSDNLGFSHIKVAELLQEEGKKDTDRGKLVSDGLQSRIRKIPDFVVVDLVKEEMLRKASSAKGYLINNFPKNHKQAHLFSKEIGEVDAIIYLICDMPIMVKRKQDKDTENKLDDEVIKKAINNYIKNIKESITRYGNKLEKINTSEATDEVYTKLEAAITMRISAKTKIRAESDYAQSQELEETPI